MSACLILAVAITAFAAEEMNSCVTCHQEIHPEVIAAFQNDVHHQAGLTCVSCHGGNAALADEDAMSPRFGYVGVPPRRGEPDFCSRCHSNPIYMRAYNTALPTDQVEKYWTSRHGERLRMGDEKVATCSSCHNAHGILPSNETKSNVHPLNVASTCAKCHSQPSVMDSYGIPTTQFAQYTDSLNVHGYALYNKRDLSAPTCNDCHGNHGALPPGVDQVAQVCNQCHAFNGELFAQSPHKEAFDALEVSECAFCHQLNPDLNFSHARIHTIVRPNYKLIGTSDNSLCAQCHSSGDLGWMTADTIAQWNELLYRRLDETTRLIHDVGAKGFEISDAEWRLTSEVRQAQMELRTAIHSFNLDHYRPNFIKADTVLRKVYQMGISAAHELKGRTLYFVIVTIAVGLLCVGLVLKLRDIEKNN